MLPALFSLLTGRQYKFLQAGQQSTMTPFRIRELEKIGFEWELRPSLGSSMSGKPSLCGSISMTSTGSATSAVEGRYPETGFFM
jgi:hypothetical protein